MGYIWPKEVDILSDTDVCNGASADKSCTGLTTTIKRVDPENPPDVRRGTRYKAWWE